MPGRSGHGARVVKQCRRRDQTNCTELDNVNHEFHYTGSQGEIQDWEFLSFVKVFKDVNELAGPG
jgi:hypothetical protein